MASAKKTEAKKPIEAKKAAEAIGEMLKAFGKTVSEILEDPELKEKARDFAESAVDATVKVVQKKIADNEVRAKVRNVGKAAQSLGKSLEDQFKS